MHIVTVYYRDDNILNLIRFCSSLQDLIFYVTKCHRTFFQYNKCINSFNFSIQIFF